MSGKSIQGFQANDDFTAAMERIAGEMGISKSELIRRAVEAYIESDIEDQRARVTSHVVAILKASKKDKELEMFRGLDYEKLMSFPRELYDHLGPRLLAATLESPKARNIIAGLLHVWVLHDYSFPEVK
jgi:transposase-like protein